MASCKNDFLCTLVVQLDWNGHLIVVFLRQCIDFVGNTRTETLLLCGQHELITTENTITWQHTLVVQWQQRNQPKKMCCTLRVFIFAYSLISVVVVVALISLVTLPRKTIMRLFCLKNRRIDGKRVTKWTSAIWLSVQRLIGPSNEIIMRLWNVTDRDHVAVWLSQGMTLCKRFALCKGIQDSLGFWIPRCGFRISGNSGFFCHWNLVSGSKR